MNRFLKVAAAVAVGIALAGCSGFDVLNLVAASTAAKATTGLSYGADPRQKLDVLVPESARPGAALPVVLFFYGGSWTAGSRTDYRFVGNALVKMGYVAVLADYRLYPQVTFPAFQRDAALALKWTRENIAGYHGDASKILVMGHSAGAHVAALLALDPSYARAAGVPDGTIKGVIGLAGPYAMVPSQIDSVRAAFAGLPDENVARPVTFVTAAAPPMLLLYGLADKTVGRANATELAQLLRAKGRDVTLIEYPDVGHPGIVLAMAPLFKGRAAVLADTKAFLDRLK